MKNLTKFVFEESDVRVLIIDNDYWFVAKDVCQVLGHGDTSKVCSRLDEDEKLVRTMFVSGQNRDMLTISESGLYNLIITSRKPKAKEFRRWVTKEVIPSIRKTGKYEINKTPELPPYEKAVQCAKAIRNIQDDLDNQPRLVQFLIDYAINEMKAELDEKNSLTGQPVKGVVEIAQELGFTVTNKNRSTLGRFVKKQIPHLVQEEQRLVNGTFRNIACYPDTEEVREAVQQFFS